MKKGSTLAAIKRMFPRPLRERVRVRGKKAFTLAEVLIALGVIGVVAAMTMPTLIKKYNEHVTVNKVKKFYSVMNQSLMLSIKDNGFVDEWNYTNVNQFADYIKPYLKIVKDCKTATGCIGESYKYLNEKVSVNYNLGTTDYDYYKLFLADGTSLWFRIGKIGTAPCTATDTGTPNVCGLLWIDVNGKKEPNILGKDTFSFFILKNRIIPHPGNDCKSKSYGYGCAQYILQNGNMNYLH